MNSSPLSTADYIVLPVSTSQHHSSSRGERESFETVATRYVSEINRGVKSSNEAKMIRFPHWQAWSPKEAYTKAINTYLLRVGGRVMYRLYKDKTFPEVMTQKMIQDLFEDIIWDKCHHLEDEHDDYKAPAKTVITRRDVEYLARSAADYVFETMTYERCRAYYLERAADGRRGGLQSRRKPTTTVNALASVEGLSKAQQAKALGVSTATIARLRVEAKRLAEQVPVAVESAPLGVIEQALVDLRNERVSQFQAMDHNVWLDDILAA